MTNNNDFEAMLKRDGFLIYKTRGVSMRPMLKQNRDLVTVRPVKGTLKKYDIPLYHRKGGGYLLHRIIKVRENDYVIRGDNTFRREYVPHSEIVGVLTEFKRKGKDHSVDERFFRVYSRVWNFIYPLRCPVHQLHVIVARAVLKLKSRG